MMEVDEQGRRIGNAAVPEVASVPQPSEIDLATWVHFNQPMKPGDCIGYLKPLFRRATLERLRQRL